MTRAFTDEPVAPSLVDDLCDLARRAPAAGKAATVDLLVLEGSDQVARYWDTTLVPSRRAGFAWPGLLRAPVLIIPWVHPEAYPRRYAEPDKAATGLGDGVAAWPVPYWWIDGGFAAMSLQLAAVDVGLGVCFFGLFDHEAAVADEFGVPPGRRALGTVALGWPAPDRPGRSAKRPRRSLGQVVHRGSW